MSDPAAVVACRSTGLGSLELGVRVAPVRMKQRGS